MAVAEMKERPSLELLFTMGEEIGLIGAHDLDLEIGMEQRDRSVRGGDRCGRPVGGDECLHGCSSVDRAKSAR